MKVNKEKNKKLIERYPFLIPHDRLTDEVLKDFDYTYTEMDDMPDGWRDAFGEQMCEEIREELVRVGHLEKYRVVQIKEKYGCLCWYDFGGTKKIDREIIPKYSHLSARICVRCGKPATKLSAGWISPYCDACADEIGDRERFIHIEKQLGKSEDDTASERIENEKDPDFF